MHCVCVRVCMCAYMYACVRVGVVYLVAFKHTHCLHWNSLFVKLLLLGNKPQLVAYYKLRFISVYESGILIYIHYHYIHLKNIASNTANFN